MAVRTRSLVLLFLALASGVAAAWLSLSYLRRETQPLLNPTATAGKAIVAAKDLPVGAVLTEQDVRVVDWPGNAVPAGLIATPQEAVGRGLMAPVKLNEPLLEAKLAPKGAGGGMAVIIEPGKRALSLRVDDVIGVAGFVQPNTRVDVLLTMATQGVGGEQTTKAILQNIQALAIGQTTTTNAQGQAQVVPVVTVLVSPEQAETLALASTQGRLQMAMRNQLDTLPIKTNGARVSALLGPVRGAPQQPSVLGYRRGGAVITSPRAPATEETIVEGFRGGERSITRFTRPKPPEDRDNK
jgi:pilus assembly protein CpaB